MPTLYGAAFGFACLLLLGIGFASTNNAVYFLCFFMVALGSQSLILTNRNIEKFLIERVSAQDFFADEAADLRVLAHNPGKEDIHEVQIEIQKENKISLESLRTGERKDLSVPLPKYPAGKHKIPNLRISSEFPYYFSRAWKRAYNENIFYVYPARAGSTQFARGAYNDLQAQDQSFDDFKGHREYQDTDSPRSIDWKVSARVQKTMVKEYDPQGSKKVILRWEDCPQNSADEKKSQLSLWIDLAEKNDFEYALELPQTHITLGKGPQHKTQCLRALL